jgi:hypothetical protein
VANAAEEAVLEATVDTEVGAPGPAEAAAAGEAAEAAAAATVALVAGRATSLRASLTAYGLLWSVSAMLRLSIGSG